MHKEGKENMKNSNLKAEAEANLRTIPTLLQ